MTQEVHDEIADGIRTLSIDRPQSKNALTGPVLEALTAGFRAAAADRETRVVILTGRGGSFCSGVDLKVAMMNGPGAIQGSARDRIAPFHALIRALRACPKPVIGLVDGPAVGFGCDLALACDLRVATEAAYFQEKFVNIGLVPDGGGTFFLPRLVGLAKAAELVMLGTKLEAAESLRLGVVNRVVPVAEGTAAARAMASALAKGPPRALARMKALLQGSLSRDFEAALDAERDAQVECLEGPEMGEGVMAFFEKREPRFPPQ